MGRYDEVGTLLEIALMIWPVVRCEPSDSVSWMCEEPSAAVTGLVSMTLLPKTVSTPDSRTTSTTRSLKASGSGSEESSLSREWTSVTLSCG